jgi:hypothetical protein
MDAWENYHRRAAAVRTVVAELDASGASEPIWNAELADVFGDRDGLLVALHDLWTRRLEGRIDMATDMGLDLPSEDVARAWREVAGELAGVRRVLDRHQDDPVLSRHELHEHRLVALAAGLASLADPVEHAAAWGARLVKDLREVPVLVPRPARLADRISATVRRAVAPELAQ